MRARTPAWPRAWRRLQARGADALCHRRGALSNFPRSSSSPTPPLLLLLLLLLLLILLLLLLARRASLDSTVKVWDPATGKERFTLARHSAMVYAMSFSPDGEFLVSGSTDRSVFVWRLRDGSLVRAFSAPSGVYDVSFNGAGDKVAVCCANAAVTVVDMRL